MREPCPRSERSATSRPGRDQTVTSPPRPYVEVAGVIDKTDKILDLGRPSLPPAPVMMITTGRAVRRSPLATRGPPAALLIEAARQGRRALNERARAVQGTNPRSPGAGPTPRGRGRRLPALRGGPRPLARSTGPPQTIRLLLVDAPNDVSAPGTRPRRSTHAWAARRPHRVDFGQPTHILPPLLLLFRPARRTLLE